MAAQGMANKMIAYKMGISEGTVKQYLFLAMNKTGARNRTQLAVAFATGNLNRDKDPKNYFMQLAGRL